VHSSTLLGRRLGETWRWPWQIVRAPSPDGDCVAFSFALWCGFAWLARFSHLGQTPAQIAQTLLLHPLGALWTTTSGRRVLTLAAVLVPFAIARCAPCCCVLAVGPFAAAHYVSARWPEF
jgi:hypothetical protein